jgi:hypothetical protein
MKNLFLFTLIVVIYASCQSNNPVNQSSKSSTGLQNGVAKEVIQTTNYTYILADMDGKKIWLAGPKFDAIVGQKYYFVQNMVMENFQSKELNRIFDTILFVQEINTDPVFFKSQSQTSNQSQTDYKPNIKITKQDIKINHEKGITSISDVFLNKEKYEGNSITVKGVVTKYNPEIMNKNWIHLQDGTDNNGQFDLVVTSLVNTKLGDTLTLTGKLALNKDFGYGYKYDVLLEDAVKK